MNRFFTIASAAAFLGSGLYLYQAKHTAELERREIRRLISEVASTREQTTRFVTDYQLENDPQRLGDLTAKFLPGLRATAPTQFTILADLDRRLPPVGPPQAAEPEPVATVGDLAFDFPPAPVRNAAVAAAEIPAPRDESRPDLERPAAAAAAASFKLATATAPEPPIAPARTTQAKPAATRSAAAIPREAPASRPQAAASYATAAEPAYRRDPTTIRAYAPAQPVAMTQAPRYYAQPAPAPYPTQYPPSYPAGGGSLLGMARQGYGQPSYQGGSPVMGNGG